MTDEAGVEEKYHKLYSLKETNNCCLYYHFYVSLNAGVSMLDFHNASISYKFLSIYIYIYVCELYTKL